MIIMLHQVESSLRRTLRNNLNCTMQQRVLQLGTHHAAAHICVTLGQLLMDVDGLMSLLEGTQHKPAFPVQV